MNAHHGAVYGDITLNDISMTRADFQKHCYYIRAIDTNRSNLTVCETLLYAAQLCHEGPYRDLCRMVNACIDSMGLNAVRDYRCSTLSTDHQKRVSLANALMKRPAILFLDDFTSGLDCASTNDICATLAKITKERNIITFFSIPKPSPQVFETFDEIMVLSEGRLAYAGSRSNAENYFGELGHPPPRNTNPADHYIELVNVGDAERLEMIFKKWKQTEHDALQLTEHTTSSSTINEKEMFQTNPILDEEELTVVDPSTRIQNSKYILPLFKEFEVIFNKWKQTEHDAIQLTEKTTSSSTINEKEMFQTNPILDEEDLTVVDSSTRRQNSKYILPLFKEIEVVFCRQLTFSSLGVSLFPYYNQSIHSSFFRI